MADVLVGDIGSGVLLYTSDINAGTGNYDSFVRIQNTGEEEGFNTDTTKQLDNKDGNFTHSLLVSNLQVVNVGGVNYYQIRLDLNETNSSTGPDITLEHLTLYAGQGTTAGSLAGLTSLWNLGTPQALVDHNSGSGSDDYYFMIPTSLVPAGTQYLTLYADFLGADGGFEEFRALSSVFTPQPEINIVKETDGTDNQCPNILQGSTVTWTYHVTNPGNVPLSNVVVTDDNGTPLNTADDWTATAVLSGGYNVGDTNHNNLLDGNETWEFTATGTAGTGEYANTGTATGSWSSTGQSGTVNASEADCYNGVTASISILKQTDGTDGACLNLINGSPVTWTYDVTNTGTAAIAGSSVAVTDDNGTPSDSTDDFNPAAVLGADLVHNIGDTNTNGVLDAGETWQYTASGTVKNGEYTNTATVDATAHDDVGGTAPVTNSESDCYNGSDPSIDIVKETNGTDNLCPVLMVGDTVTWTYAVTNNSAFGITNVVVTDDNGTPGVLNNGDDFHPAAVLSGAFNIGDTNTNNVLDPGETWQYSQTGIVALGHYENVATVTGTATDGNGYTAPVTNNESDCYLGLQGPCPRTPGFWSHWTDFWNGTASVPKQAGQPDFPAYDLLRIDSNHDGVINGSDSGYSMYNGQLGLLIGDYNRNGMQDSGEDIVFVSLNNALSLINASTKQMSDGVVKVGRDVVATWLNYLMGSPIGTVDSGDGHYSPKEAINDAINYLQTFGDSNASNTYLPGETFDTYSPTHTAVKTSTNFWTGNIVGHSGADIHSALDGYNNTGTIDGWVYAPDCDNQQYLNDLHGYALNGSLFAA
jgi:hypothetical protein